MQMIETVLGTVGRWIVNQITALGYPGVVLLMAIESACIPLPSEVIMPFSGYLVHQGTFSLRWAALSGALGCAVGSTAAYAVGIWGGRPFIERYGRYVLIRGKDLDRADRFFVRYGDWAVFISRLLPVVRTFISLPAGIARMRFARFIVLSFLGSVPWCYFLTYVGVVLGRNWADVKRYFHRADVVVVAIFAVLLAWWLWNHLKAEDRS
jgi:membrane protein DedA with SNARE-associated domain